MASRAGRWVKDWVPQKLIPPGGKCSLYRWIREDELAALKDKDKESDAEEDPESEPTTEVLFLCTSEGCGRIFVDAGALRKHTHIHGERQHVCHFKGCGKKFLDSSKLKRHFLIHTGEKNFVCTYEGCGKAFSLDFNLKAHMKTHLPENYHPCPYQDCDRRFTQECKLKAHIRAQHEKDAATPPAFRSLPKGKHHAMLTPKATAAAAINVSVDRPYTCHYDGCGKAYIHEYKLNLHLRKEHPSHVLKQGDRSHFISNGSGKKNNKRTAPAHAPKMLLPKVPKHNDFGMLPSPARNTADYDEHWASRGSLDSEETLEEDRDNAGEHRGYAEFSEEDNDDETEED